VEVDRLTGDEIGLTGYWEPHWISMEPDGDRIVLTSSSGETVHRVLVLRLDPETGDLSLDPSFRDPDSEVPGVRFDRSVWPHGAAGPARPHGSVFARPGARTDRAP
jgi:hypothetical protein